MYQYNYKKGNFVVLIEINNKDWYNGTTQSFYHSMKHADSGTKKKNLDYTMKFEYTRDNTMTIKEVLNSVWKSLEEKGYNPKNQLVGYLLSGDPSYITSYNNARTMIRAFERDEILEVVLEQYIAQK